ncbi:Maf family protein [Aestuariirhabdus litorea]|uniref:7-methyl-GTP pyrophosphatase n=1 Tax=Aestuariirhabdus litorea TaxID=2528527 RepID=A0A3P3VRT6_9GAMM|nr:nucleoside triphosphate pyrophosphatase [Aestuariirhabdus litorea]RRJ84698.1 septum formation protein Maf [Aestuariirhabdus litorea]RWW97923.1 septum formation protein Maf [Endozoicomonadaceae bacterium GTF-13]
MNSSPPRLLLASSSRYRRMLLDQLGLVYDWEAPGIDETPALGEHPETLALRLAREKALCLRDRYPNHLLIASDQVAVLGDQLLGKPGSRERAVEQLRICSGRRVDFLTSLCVFNSTSGVERLSVSRYAVQFRVLSPTQIERYIDREQPFDCAGSFKVEGLGAALFSAQYGEDPSSLIGLPLIALCDALYAEGVDPLLGQSS